MADSRERITRQEHIHALLVEAGVQTEELYLELSYQNAKKRVETLETVTRNRSGALVQQLRGDVPPAATVNTLLKTEINKALEELPVARRELNRLEILMRQKGRL